LFLIPYNLDLMRKITLLLFVTVIFSCNSGFTQIHFNGDLEKIDPLTHMPVGWNYGRGAASAYDFKLDSVVTQQGKYSVSITRKNDSAGFASIMFYTPTRFKGKEIELRGYLKTEDVSKGFAGLWMRIDGTSAFNNMQGQNLHGTNDWKEYSIKLPYDSEHAINVNAGVLLVGPGKIWLDNLQLLIDGKPIDIASTVPIILTKAEQDTAFSKASPVKSIVLNDQQLTNLRLLCQVWGFIKYHHPEVAKGNFNMDAELFRVMPAVLKATNNTELSAALEHWVDKFGVPAACSNCKLPKDDIAATPDYGQLFTRQVLSPSLTGKLKYILDNDNISKSYYIDMAQGVGNPIFQHELAYSKMIYPDAGYRLLCLFRYWNMIQYFYPYKHLIGEDWNTILPKYIPKFVDDANAQAYTLTTLEMISNIHDTHANIWSMIPELERYRGIYAPPVQAKFIEDKLVVTGYYADTLGIKDKLKVGDVILSINGQPVDALVKKYLPVTAASNYSTQLRDMPHMYLLRGDSRTFKLSIDHLGEKKDVEVEGISNSAINYGLDFNPAPKSPGYYLIDDGKIGYLFPGRYHNSDLPAIKELFKNTRGIIVDMRCYPSEFMPFTFVPYIKTGDAPFVKFTTGSINHPGYFTTTPLLKDNGEGTYKGKVIVIVNPITQSQAEYTTMAFQSSPNVTVIGGTTAGADGNVSQIVLPGNINTLISGIDVLYPDGTETQRKGVKVNIEVKPTIRGVRDGKDEQLDKAREMILGSKIE